MRAGRRWAFILLAGLLLLPSLDRAGASGPTLEGRWRLTQERAGARRGDLLPARTPVFIEFARDPQGRLAGRIGSGEDPSRGVPWPALISAAGPFPIVVEEIWTDPGERSIRAVYRVPPRPPDGRGLRVTEEYSVDRGGDILTGVIRIAALENDEERGSYSVFRRFEREP